MNLEIEAKLKVDSLAPFQNLLQSLCPPPKILTQIDTFFDRPDRSLLHAGSGLRIRRESSPGASSVILCWKGPRSPASALKQRQEIELSTDNYENALAFLSALGFVPVLTVEKQRIQYQLDTCAVCLDEVKDLGVFIEIEGPNESSIASVARKLNLDPDRHIPQSYACLISEKANDAWRTNS